MRGESNALVMKYAAVYDGSGNRFGIPTSCDVG